MSAALKFMDVDTFQASPEAGERIQNARLADLTFMVRRIVKSDMPTEDVAALASCLLELERNSEPLTRAALMSRLIARGRSRHKSEILVNAIIR